MRKMELLSRGCDIQRWQQSKYQVKASGLSSALPCLVIQEIRKLGEAVERFPSAVPEQPREGPEKSLVRYRS